MEIFIDYNNYYNGNHAGTSGTGNNILNWYNTSTVTDWTLNEVKYYSSYEDNGDNENPRFVNNSPIYTEDFLLDQSQYCCLSPCLGAGTTNIGTTWTDWNIDFDGDERGSAGLGSWDKGAWEQNDDPASPTRSVSVNGYLSAYPSPFNPTTNINFIIPKDGIVSLKVYDILGTEIASLVNEYKTAGEYSIIFNGEHLSSGIYLCVLKSDYYNDIKKMILLK